MPLFLRGGVPAEQLDPADLWSIWRVVSAAPHVWLWVRRCLFPRSTSSARHNITAILLFSVMTCPMVSPLTNGAVTCTDPLGPSSYQSSCVFTCDEGYTLIGSNALQCQASGVWNSSQPFCAGMSEEVSTTLPVNAVFVKHWQKQGDPVDLFCLSLWFLAVQCPALQELENGLTSCDDDKGRNFSYGNTCSFSCAPGYQLVGPTTITCTSAATWTESVPRCTGESVPTSSCVLCKEVFLAFRG